MTARALMIQGTGSDVGKSIVVAGLCRAAKIRGLRVAPFKPQNMSNNSAACPKGGEIGRAQALQALAAGVEPHIDQNPVLLKPETDRIAQVVVHGQAVSSMDASSYMGSRDKLLKPVMESFNRLRAQYDLVLVEGAGSPAETNLRDRDIANMGFAVAGGVPVCLLGDIERGGVIASIVGTHSVLSKQDTAMIIGFAINKFRGDQRLFDDGIVDIEQRTGWPCFGVIPWIRATASLPAEDAVSIVKERADENSTVKIVAPMLSRMANFDDADPLRMEPNVDFRFVPPGQALPADAGLIVLFGTKSTLGDLKFLRGQGWDHDIIAHANRGGQVLGICGGYQMLGRIVVDDAGVDGEAGSSAGLGLLDVETTMHEQKQVRPVNGHCTQSRCSVTGYEIHVGDTTGPDCERPMLTIDGRPEGATSQNGRVRGSYVHGLLTDDGYRSAFLRGLGHRSSSMSYDDAVEAALDELAAELEAALNIDGLFACAR